jgi:exopolysaccharide biosynthesis polyprenyl glycosylphosphotransferase
MGRSAGDDVPALFALAVCCVGGMALVDRALTPGAALILLASLVATTRLGRILFRVVWRRNTPRERVLVIGSPDLHGRLARKIELDPALHIDIAGYIDAEGMSCESLDASQLSDSLGAIANDLRCQRLVVGTDGMRDSVLRTVSVAAHRGQLKVSILPSLQGAIGSRAKLTQLAELPMLEFACQPMPRATACGKRALDIAMSSTLLLLAAPVMALIAVAIRLEDGGPAFFRQVRGGLDGRPFVMYKFRTMVVDAEARIREAVDLDTLLHPMYNKVDKDSRVTRVGYVLRKSSLDELPQLINVLVGAMSMVGPRPEDIRLVQRYDADALAIRCGMRPGITGPMQVHGRGRLTFEERLAVECEYLENHSFSLDVRILALTLGTVVGGRGAS